MQLAYVDACLRTGIARILTSIGGLRYDEPELKLKILPDLDVEAI